LGRLLWFRRAFPSTTLDKQVLCVKNTKEHLCCQSNTPPEHTGPTACPAHHFIWKTGPASAITIFIEIRRTTPSARRFYETTATGFYIVDHRYFGLLSEPL
jgi:hypothetical protein